MLNSVEGSDFKIEITHCGDYVSSIVFDRPPLNYFSYELLSVIIDEIDELASSPDTRAIVLGRRGKHFCVGADFTASNTGVKSMGESQFGPHLYDLAIRMMMCPVPIVAATQGRVVGGGFGLAMACDFRISSSDAKFSAAFARLGIHHGFGLSATLPDAVGNLQARRILYGRGELNAVEALDVGLIQAVVNPDDLHSDAVAFAADFASGAPLATRAIRQTLREVLISDFVAAVRRERRAQVLLSQTEDAHEGVQASRERRAPEFKGN
jgi:enoyl-CoA hydratase/carnithine racemase